MGCGRPNSSSQVLTTPPQSPPRTLQNIGGNLSPSPALLGGGRTVLRERAWLPARDRELVAPQRPAEPPPQLLPRPHLLRCCTPTGPRLSRAPSAACFLRHAGQSVQGLPELRPAGVAVQGQGQDLARFEQQQAQSCPNTTSQVQIRQHPGSPCTCRRLAPGSDIQPYREGTTAGGRWGPSLRAASQHLDAAAAGQVSRQTSSPGLTPTDPKCLSRQPQGLRYPPLFPPQMRP